METFKELSRVNFEIDHIKFEINHLIDREGED